MVLDNDLSFELVELWYGFDVKIVLIVRGIYLGVNLVFGVLIVRVIYIVGLIVWGW